MELEQLFRSYLGGELSKEDTALVEKLLNESPEYQVQLKHYKSRSKDIPDQLTGDISPIKKTSSKTRSILNWSISAGIAIIIVLVGYFLITTLSMPLGEKLYRSFYEPRQASNSTNQSDNQMASKAFSYYESGDYEQALVLFENLVLEDNSQVMRLYVGLSQLGINRPEKAIPVLSLIKTDSDLFMDANWYLAMGYLKLNKMEEAKRHLEISASKLNPYSAKANEILSKIK